MIKMLLSLKELVALEMMLSLSLMKRLRVTKNQSRMDKLNRLPSIVCLVPKTSKKKLTKKVEKKLCLAR